MLNGIEMVMNQVRAFPVCDILHVMVASRFAIALACSMTEPAYSDAASD
jgi:hypothetical protein